MSYLCLSWLIALQYMSPQEILFGHTVILPVGMVLGRINPEKYKYNLNYENTRDLVLKIEKIHEFAWEKLNISITKMARDNNSKIQQKSYNPGDAVWVFYPNQNLGKVHTLFYRKSMMFFTRLAKILNTRGLKYITIGLNQIPVQICQHGSNLPDFNPNNSLLSLLFQKNSTSKMHKCKPKTHKF